MSLHAMPELSGGWVVVVVGACVAKRYPDDPRNLPAAVHAHAYDPHDPPVGMALPRLASIVQNHIPLRKTVDCS